jgi:hypothetical protein
MTQPEESQEPQEEEPQKPATGGTRTVLSSGVVWEEEVEEGTEQAKRPDRPTRKKEEEEKEQRETRTTHRDRRPTRKKEEGQRGGAAMRSGWPTRRAARRKNASALPIFLGVGGVLVAASVTVALIVALRPKATNSAELGTNNRTELFDKGREQPRAPVPATPSAPNTSTPSVSNNKGKIEGTKWSSQATTVKGQFVPEGTFRLDLGADGGLVFQMGLGTLTGRYVLGTGDTVTLEFDQELGGRRTHLETVVITGEQLQMIDPDGTTLTFRRVR